MAVNEVRSVFNIPNNQDDRDNLAKIERVLNSLGVLRNKFDYELDPIPVALTFRDKEQYVSFIQQIIELEVPLEKYSIL